MKHATVEEARAHEVFRNAGVDNTRAEFLAVAGFTTLAEVATINDIELRQRFGGYIDSRQIARIRTAIPYQSQSVRCECCNGTGVQPINEVTHAAP